MRMQILYSANNLLNYMFLRRDECETIIKLRQREKKKKKKRDSKDSNND